MSMFIGSPPLRRRNRLPDRPRSRDDRPGAGASSPCKTLGHASRIGNQLEKWATNCAPIGWRNPAGMPRDLGAFSPRLDRAPITANRPAYLHGLASITKVEMQGNGRRPPRMLGEHRRGPSRFTLDGIRSLTCCQAKNRECRFLHSIPTRPPRSLASSPTIQLDGYFTLVCVL